MKNRKVIFTVYMVIITAIFGVANVFSQHVLKVSADGSEEYTTLTEAIAAASSGDVIEVYGTITGDGVPTHGIIIDKNLTIRGQGAEETIIEGSSTELDEKINQRIFTIAPGVTVTIQNLAIRNGYLHDQEISQRGAGIKNSGNLIIRNCEVYKNYVKRSDCLFEGGIFNEGEGAIAFDKYTPPADKIAVSGL